MILRSLSSAVVLLSIIIIISGCQAFRPPAEAVYTSGATVESLSGNVSLSFATHDRSVTGSGFLMYRKPDQLRAVILSPFGSVIQEIYVNGELVTIIDAGNGTAFSGNFTDLPDKGDLSGWRHIHWLIDIDPYDSSRRTAAIERINRFGQPEKVVIENGLLISKSTSAGGNVRYGRYTAVRGAPLPLEITYETVSGEKFTILLEDPEVNVPFEVGAFTPKLSKLRVYPLSALK